MLRIVLCYCLCLIASLPAFGQEPTAGSGLLSGKIFDRETRAPIVAANVYLDSVHLGATTNEQGQFSIRYIPPGTYRLVAEYLGYEAYTEKALKIEQGKLVSRSIGLKSTELAGQEVIVTAARKPQTTQQTPASIVLMTAAELRDRPITTFDQALESVPGLSVYRTAGVSVQSLSIRGSSDVAGGGVGNRVLLLIDGRPALTSDAGGAYWGLVPTNFIDRVEVVKGAFSSLYGSTAMGGVVNVITSRPQYRSLGTVKLGLGLYRSPASDEQFKDGPLFLNQMEANYSGANGKVSYLMSASRKQSDGHSEQAAYTFYNLYSKMMFDLGFNRNIELTLGGGSSKNDYPHSWLNAGQPLRVRARYRDDFQEKKQFNMDLHYWAVPNHRARYDSRFYFYYTDARSFFNPNDPLRQIPGNEPFGQSTRSEGRKFGNISQLDYYVTPKLYLIAGTDVQVDVVDAVPDSILYGRQQLNNIAGYLQAESKLHPKLTTTLGIRYDYNHLVGGKSLTHMSPKISLLYQPLSNTALRLLYGRAFRAPTIAERFFKVELGGGILFRENPDLRAEKMTVSLEAGLKQRVKNRLTFDIALYHYRYSDLIYWVDIAAETGVTFPYFEVRNLNRAQTQGLELTVSGQLSSSISAAVNYTFLDAKDLSPDRSDDLLAYRPKHTASANLAWRFSRYRLYLDGRFRSKIEEVFLYPLQRPQAFAVANGKLSATVFNGLELSLSVNNLFDREYEELARYRMPGRNYLVGLRYDF